MSTPTETTWCLTHQAPENCSSMYGAVCPACRRLVGNISPLAKRMAYWESQPVACSLDGDPLFVFTLRWPNRTVRSLHFESASSPQEAHA